MNLFACSPTPGARSLQAFGLYLCGAGALLLLAPSVLLTPLSLPIPQDAWIRILGVVALALGISDLMASREHGVTLLKASVWRRALAGAALLALVGAEVAPAAVLLFAAVDVGTAAWTATALCRPSPSHLKTT